VRPLARVAVLFGAGAAIGTLADQLHVQTGVLSYRHPRRALFGQALWVPLLFGASGLALTAGHAGLARLAAERAPRAALPELARSLLWFFAAYASTSAYQQRPRRLALTLVSCWMARVLAAPTAGKLVAGPLLAAAGPLFESWLSSTGAFRYRRPDAMGLPLWLPALYLHAALMVREGQLALFPPARARGFAPGRPR
jgi:hypothetical protein